MKPDQIWKNFDLGQEVSVSGAFIHDGLRCFHEMKTLENADEVFQFLYQVAVGLERLLKVAVTLFEHDGAQDQHSFERSLITHNHLELLRRVEVHSHINVGRPHHEFLALLGKFYRTLRYSRFSLAAQWDPHVERDELVRFIEKHLKMTFESSNSFFPTRNDARIRRHMSRVVSKLCRELYGVIRQQAGQLNLYTYELRYGSKAEKIFLRAEYDFSSEEVLWKELLVYFMNTNDGCGILTFLRGIHPLEFDVGLAGEYLQCFESTQARAEAMGELQELYAQLDDPGNRLDLMSVIANPNVYFDEDDEEDRDGD
jgi:hypothetical protein